MDRFSGVYPNDSMKCLADIVFEGPWETCLERTKPVDRLQTKASSHFKEKQICFRSLMNNEVTQTQKKRPFRGYAQCAWVDCTTGSVKLLPWTNGWLIWWKIHQNNFTSMSSSHCYLIFPRWDALDSVKPGNHQSLSEIPLVAKQHGTENQHRTTDKGPKAKKKKVEKKRNKK